MRRLFNEYFNFSKRERRGILVLIILISTLIVTNLVIDYRINKKQVDFTGFEKEIDKWMASNIIEVLPSSEFFYFDPNIATIEQFISLGIPDFVANNIISYRNKGGQFKTPNDFARIYGLSPDIYDSLKPFISIKSKNASNKNHNDIVVELKNFDPNRADKNILVGLGFKPYLANNLINYRNSGAVFKEKEDLLKLYGMDSSFYSEIEDYISIDTSALENIVETNTDTILIELSSADEAEFMKLNGIGPSYSNRIVKYRTQLGGFIKIDQLYEVYGLNTELVDKIKTQIVLDTIIIDCIDINTADYITLIKHPYLEKSDVQAILNYRKLIGEFMSKEELISQKVIPEDVFSRLSPYICVE